MKLKPIDGRKYFVHRYKWTHEAKRKQFLRAFKEGKAVLVLDRVCYLGSDRLTKSAFDRLTIRRAER
jgi:hypothetical protein